MVFKNKLTTNKFKFVFLVKKIAVVFENSITAQSLHFFTLKNDKLCSCCNTIVAFQSVIVSLVSVCRLHLAIARCDTEIFFMYFWVIMLCPVVVR